MFAKAPTGIGKTISTTYPAIKAMGSGMLQRFYYLTARTTTRAAAEDALLFMRDKGLHLQAVTITAKDKICFQEEVRCEKEHCPYADGYYDRINGAVLDILEQETVMTRPVIEAYAQKHRVCPFEFSLDLAYAADAVICDYNYIFVPRISFNRRYAEMKKRTALLVDEAHNLVDRAREMFSAELTKAPFLALQRELKDVMARVTARRRRSIIIHRVAQTERRGAAFVATAASGGAGCVWRKHSLRAAEQALAAGLAEVQADSCSICILRRKILSARLSCSMMRYLVFTGAIQKRCTGLSCIA